MIDQLRFQRKVAPIYGYLARSSRIASVTYWARSSSVTVLNSW